MSDSLSVSLPLTIFLSSAQRSWLTTLSDCYRAYHLHHGYIPLEAEVSLSFALSFPVFITFYSPFVLIQPACFLCVSLSYILLLCVSLFCLSVSLCLSVCYSVLLCGCLVCVRVSLSLCLSLSLSLSLSCLSVCLPSRWPLDPRLLLQAMSDTECHCHTFSSSC